MRIAVLAATPLIHDARVVRTARTLAEAGHKVTVIAHEPIPPGLPFRVEQLPALPRPVLQRLQLLLTQGPATLVPHLAPPLYWTLSIRHQMSALALAADPDVVLCNDWITLPIGVHIKRQTGAYLIYDSHEYSVMEHIQNWKWVLVSRQAVATLEGRYIREADLVVTVSSGIARALQERYRLSRTPVVVRNLPDYQAPPGRDPSPRRTVLFHGLIRPERGLEELIRSIPLWTFEGRVVLRGYGSVPYVKGLRALATRLGVEERLQCEPAVRPEELVSRASDADIGYLALPATSDHYEFALPNKTFEYLMAGLSVLATPRTEIHHLLTSTGAGIFIDLTSQSIASALNQLSQDDLSRMRAAALGAAADLHWDVEKGKLVSAVDALIDAHPRQ